MVFALPPSPLDSVVCNQMTTDPNAIAVLRCARPRLTELDTTSPEHDPDTEKKKGQSGTRWPVCGVGASKQWIVWNWANRPQHRRSKHACTQSVRGSADKERLFPPEFRLGTVPDSAISSASWDQYKPLNASYHAVSRVYPRGIFRTHISLQMHGPPKALGLLPWLPRESEVLAM